MDKHEIISDMCMTMDHRYFASPEMFANDSINKDFTQEYKDSLYLQMKQIFENNIEPILNQFACLPNERAFLDEIMEKGIVNDGASETLIEIGEWSRITQSDFKSNLKELVNDTQTKAD